MIQRKIAKIIKIILIGIIAVAVFGFVVKALWNGILPQLFGWHTITFWQAVGLLLLSKILFGGFRGGPRAGRHWRGRLAERWEQMSVEEREKFGRGLRGRCGPRGFRTEGGAS